MEQAFWQRVGQVFESVSGLAGERLQAALIEHCGDDRALCREVESLVAADRDAEFWLAGLTVRAGIPGPEAEATLNAPGRMIGAWRLVRQLGRGGMGVVYLAERADGQFVMKAALKALPVGLVTPEAVACFARERDILARLDHPNIARLIDGGITPEGTPFYVMEYVDGLPLGSYCEKHRPALSERLELFEKIASAVVYAHRHLVIHRDIKPSNVVVSDDGEPKLLDFGIARLVEAERTDTRTATRPAGRHITPAYTAPELLQGEPATTACDVYSLGVVLYELLSGMPPFEPGFFDAPGWTDRLAVRKVQPPSMAAREEAARHQLKGDLDTIVTMAMHPDPSRRYATVNALLKDLERHRQCLPVSARRDSIGYRINRFVCRNAVAAGLTLLVMLSLLAGMGTAVHFAMEAKEQARVAQDDRLQAEVVTNFLADLFTSADPFTRPDQDASLVNVLSRGTETVRSRSDLPEPARARILHVLGRSQLGLSNYEQARALLSDAERLMRERAGESGETLAAVLIDKGRLEYLSGRLDEAERNVREALDIYGNHHNGPDSGSAEALFWLATIRMEQGDYEQALAELEKSRRMFQNLPGAFNGTIKKKMIQSSNLKGFILEKLQQYDQANELYREAYVLALEHLPDPHPLTAIILNSLGRLAMTLGEPEQALQLHEQALGMRTALFGNEHREVAISHHNLAGTLDQLQRFDQAYRHIRRALSIYRSILGERFWLTARAEEVAARIQAHRGNLHAALALLDHARSVKIEHFGKDHLEVIINRLASGYVLNQLEEYGQAASQLRKARDSLQAHEPPLPVFEQEIAIRLAVSLAGQGKFAAARAIITDHCPGAHQTVLRLNPDIPVCGYAAARIEKWIAHNE